MSHNIPTNKVIIGIPTFDGKIDNETVNSLFNLNKSFFDLKLLMPYRLPACYARQNILQEAYFTKSNILFLDDDQTIDSDGLYDLYNTSLHHGFDIVGVPYMIRQLTDYKASSIGVIKEDTYNGLNVDMLKDIDECDSIGTGCMFISYKAVKTIYEHNKNCFTYGKVGDLTFPEDVMFCVEAKKLGLKLGYNNKIKSSHIEKKREILNVSDFVSGK